MDNIVHIRTDEATNQVDLGHLEEILRDLTARDIPIATVVCTMGTTDAGAFDPLGKAGMQAILGSILESKYCLFDLLRTCPDMVCVNPEDSGLVTLFRIYPEGVDAQAQYLRELNEPHMAEALLRHNRLREAVGNQLFEWFRGGIKIEGKNVPYLSFSTGFRNTNYDRDGTHHN